MLELVDGGRRVAAEVFDGVLVAEPVGPLDGVVHVPAPVVRAHVAERGGDAALRRDGVRARREHLGDAGGLQAGLGAAERGAQAGAAGADHDDVVGMVGDGIGAAVDLRGAAVAAAIPSAMSASEAQLQDGKDETARDREREEGVARIADELAPSPCT